MFKNQRRQYYSYDPTEPAYMESLVAFAIRRLGPTKCFAISTLGALSVTIVGLILAGAPGVVLVKPYLPF